MVAEEPGHLDEEARTSSSTSSGWLRGSRRSRARDGLRHRHAPPDAAHDRRRLVLTEVDDGMARDLREHFAQGVFDLLGRGEDGAPQQIVEQPGDLLELGEWSTTVGGRRAASTDSAPSQGSG